MDAHRGTKHIIVMYALIIMLAALLLYVGVKVTQINGTEDAGTWKCSNAVCSQFVNPQQWISKFCEPLTLENGTQLMTCTINIDGSPTQVPLEAINLTFVSQQCEVAVCVQETNVREVNYTLPSLP